MRRVSCMVFTPDEFEQLLKTLYPDNQIWTDYSLDGLTICIDDDAVDDDDLHRKIAEHYDISRVTSYHLDSGFDQTLVWVAYIPKE